MSRVKQLIQIINGCDKKEFDKIVKSYLKNIYGFERIVVTDGKDDTGIDLKVFDYGGQKNQYQMTIQKSRTPQERSQLKTKIFEDVEKAKTNNTEYGYSNNLYFFYSYEMTNKTQREYAREALDSYNINLFIVDANQIAEESEDNIELQQTIYNQNGLADFQLKKSLFEDKNTCMVYDLVSFGKSSDLKLEIVEAFIFQCLYENGPLSQEQIAKLCIDKFASKENPTFYSKLINKLHSREKKLLYSKATKCYSLSQEEHELFNKRIEQMKMDEQSFINEIGNVLAQFKQDPFIDDYVRLLRELYTNALSKRIEIVQLLEDDSDELKKLLSFGRKQLGSHEPVNEMICQLFQVCDKNKFLQKICASSIFSSKISVDNLEKYAAERKQVYIDTTIALNILCLFYKKTEYQEYNFQLSKSLSEYCRKNGIKLHLTERYLWEITGHIREAFSLVPFTKIPGFKSLGKSRNVFYNYYDFLVETGALDCSFSDFLIDFGFKDSDLNKTEKLNQTITKYLSDIGVEVLQIPARYDIEATRKTLEITLAELDRFKTSFAIENDCIMLKYLGDDNYETHKIDPVFITWDKSLYKVLKDFFDENPNLKKWMQFTPSQFIDRYSLLSFSISSETISKEMLAILSGDIIQHTISLLDSLSLILDPETEVGLEYTKKITEIKNSQIYTINKIPQEGKEITIQDPIDYVVYNITNLYRDNPLQYKKFKELLSIKEYINDVINIIVDSIRYYVNNKRFDKNTKTKFDQLIEKIDLCPSTK